VKGGMQSLDGTHASFASTLPHAQTRMQLSTKLKKHSSEPLMAHQAAVPMRYTPHPNKVVQNRWPMPGWKQGGVIDPQDLRRHAYDFGHRPQRWQPPKQQHGVGAEIVPELSLDELKNYLTKQYGSLKRAFDVMDFFKDGQISAIEWQEGMYNTLAGAFGKEDHKFRTAIVPRKQFNARMQHMFAIMDQDCNGLISFDELSRPYFEPEESSHNFTRRRKLERDTHTEEKQVALSRSMLTGSMEARRKGPPPHHEEKRDGAPTPLRDFAVYLLNAFKDVNAAFSEFDVAANGQLNLAEFVEGARRIKYKGDAEEIFLLLDQGQTGTVGKEDWSTAAAADCFSTRPSRQRLARDDLVVAWRLPQRCNAASQTSSKHQGSSSTSMRGDPFGQ